MYVHVYVNGFLEGPLILRRNEGRGMKVLISECDVFPSIHVAWYYSDNDFVIPTFDFIACSSVPCVTL